jgi:hypothetical protein
VRGVWGKRQWRGSERAADVLSYLIARRRVVVAAAGACDNEKVGGSGGSRCMIRRRWQWRGTMSRELRHAQVDEGTGSWWRESNGSKGRGEQECAIMHNVSDGQQQQGWARDESGWWPRRVPTTAERKVTGRGGMTG